MSKKEENLKTPNVRVMYDKILTSAETKKVTESGILLAEEVITTRQIVLVAGPTSDVKVGDEVEIDTSRFPVRNLGPKQVGSVSDIGPDRRGAIIAPIVVIEGIPCMYLTNREIKWVYVKEEENITISN